MQVWTQRMQGQDGTVEWALPSQVYAWNLETSGQRVSPLGGGESSAGARAPISPWTFIGCWKSVVSGDTATNMDPLRCTIHCDLRGFSLTAMKGTDCYCFKGRDFLIERVSQYRCVQRCMPTYFNGTTRLCGSAGQYVSAYQKYDFVHQTAQGCYDPWRFIWYQSVAIERLENDTVTGEVVGNSYEWYLHAASINSGDPLFPYHLPLENLLLGLQYDLDNSRLVGYSVPYWKQKDALEPFSPAVQIYKVQSLREDEISFSMETVPLTVDDSSAAHALFGTGVTALDAMNDVYYITVPTIPQVPGTGYIFTSFRTKIYGININMSTGDRGDRFVVNQDLDQQVVLLESNSKFHDLFALLRQEGENEEQPNMFYYVRLGESLRNNRTNFVEFEWTFTTPQESVVNPYSYHGFSNKYYQVGSTGVDHVSNTSFVVYKDLPHSGEPFHVQDLNQRGFMESLNYDALQSPDTQATWLANTDPMIPLTLAAPRLLWARFTNDGRSIIVQFDSATVEGAVPVDTDGDFLPDSIDWTKQHIGKRNCSDMFARATASLLGDMPRTSCEWRSGTTIKIHLSPDKQGIDVGDGLFLRDSTVYAHLVEGNEWSMAASGGIGVGYPVPLEAPVVDVTFSRTVDLCSPITLNGLKSYYHGGEPHWVWTLKRVTCESGRPTNAAIKDHIRELLEQASVGGEREHGHHSVRFEADGLDPGCTYKILVSLTGRWGITTEKELTLTKNSVPVPQVAVQGLTEVMTMRSKDLTLQTQVARSSCESLFAVQRQLRFKWTAAVQQENEFNSALLTKSVDLQLMGLHDTSPTLVIPARKLQPDASYTFTVKVFYDESGSDPDASTTSMVYVTVARSPIKVNILGGSRKAMKSNPIALDSRTSIDPDYPNMLIEANWDWKFSYQCNTLQGEACVPLNADSSFLPDVRDCQFSAVSFKDLGLYYSLPSFSSSTMATESYYCRDPVRNGILVVNLQNENAFMPGTYIFTVTAEAHGRKATTSMTLEVTPGEMDAPSVVIEKLSASRIKTTSVLKVQGNLIPEDRAQFGENVAWSWSFFRQEANPRWSQKDAKAAKKGETEPYLVPPLIFNPAQELDPLSRGTSAFNSDPLSSNNLVIKANVLLPSSIYSFRLSATTPHPLGGEPLVGYGDITVQTAGPPPVPGALNVKPEGESRSDTEKVLTAVDWTADDVPLMYMYTYRADPEAEYDDTMQLRMSALSAPSQVVRCLKPGKATNNYEIEITVAVVSLYGATTNYAQRYRSLPPEDPVSANIALFELAGQVDPETRPSILGCMTFDQPPAEPPDTDGDLSTTARPTLSPADEAKLKEQATAMVDMLDRASENAAVTFAAIASNLQAIQDISAAGTVSDNMVDFVEKLTTSATSLSDDVEVTDEARNDIVQSVFNTLGMMGLANSNQDSTAVNANDAGVGAFFPMGGEANQRRLQQEGLALSPTSPVMRHMEATGSRRLFTSALDAYGDKHYIIQAGAYPDWGTLPVESRDLDYTDNGVTLPRRTATVGDVSPDSPATYDSMYKSLEALELEWLAYIRSNNDMNARIQADKARDDEYFANYSAHLSAEARESVVRRWWEERARREAAGAAATYSSSRLTKKVLEQVGRVGGMLVKHMVTGEQAKEFAFPLGVIRLGKARSLADADPSFRFQGEKWRKEVEDSSSFGFGSIKFTRTNPMSWAPGSQMGPYLVSSLEIYRDDGTRIPVEREAKPISIMSEHSSFASASCYFWDWEAGNGVGGWTRTGVLNAGNGCSTTHLSIFGMFLDEDSPIIELPSGTDIFLEESVKEHNTVVVAAIAGVLVLCGVCHYWGFKQDGVDRAKPLEMKKLGDGVTRPLSQDDPIHYSPHHWDQVLRTFWNLLRRDHILVAVFCRCPNLKSTRLQKASVLFAMISGNTAVSAVFYGERVVDPKHFIEVGVIAATVIFPMTRMLLLMFSSRPYRDVPSNDSSIFLGRSQKTGECFGPLEAVPVPEDEQEDYGDEEGEGLADGPSPPPFAGVSPQGVLGSPTVAELRTAGEVGLPSSAPEEGGGPQLSAVARVLSTSLPLPPTLAPPSAPPRPPPPRTSRTQGESGVDEPPPPPPFPAPQASQQGYTAGFPTPSWVAGTAAWESMDRPPSEEGSTGAQPASNMQRFPAPPLFQQYAAPPPLPPLGGPWAEGGQEYTLALRDPGAPSDDLALSPALPPLDEDTVAAEVALSQSQAQLLRRVRRMYIEKVIRNSERLAYDERVDMRQSVASPLAHVANVLAHTAVACYWATALVLTVVYSAHLNRKTAVRWLYACLCSWGFTWFVLEMVKAMLVTILVLQQLNQRRRLNDHKSLKDQVALKKAMKMRRMTAMARAAGMDVQKMLPPPVPPEPSMGDASAG